MEYIDAISIGLHPDECWVVHYNNNMKYLTDDEEEANVMLAYYVKNQDIPFYKTRLDKFVEWCKLHENY